MKKPLIDRLYQRVAQRGHVCLGLDTDLNYLPDDLRRSAKYPADALIEFNRRIIDNTLDVTAVYKVQIAYYEALGLEGMRAYAETLRYLREQDAIVIADVKRGDIAKTAEMYARAHFSGDFEADFITVNPFMGMDTLAPFFPFLKNRDKGLFALVATSNPGASDIEGIASGGGASVSELVGDMIVEQGAPFVGSCGYSAIGAVVGCTNKAQTRSIRSRMKGCFFLIPGYGAQGGTAQDMADYLQNGNGGVVNSSRGILLAYQGDRFGGLSFEKAARQECIRMRDEIRECI